MSVDGFYRLRPKGGVTPAAFFRATCERFKVTEVDFNVWPTTLDDVAVAVSTYGLDEAFTQIGCQAPLDRSAKDDLRARRAAFPGATAQTATLAYERGGETLAPWVALGSKRRTPVVESFRVGLDLRAPVVMLEADLDYSKSARSLKGDLKERFVAWWRQRMKMVFEGWLRALGTPADLDLTPGAERVSAHEVEVTLDAKPFYPRVLVRFADEARAAAALEGALADPELRDVVVELKGTAREVLALGAWAPPAKRIHGPSSFDPFPLARVERPAAPFSGSVDFTALLDLGKEQLSGDLTLRLGEKEALEYVVRFGLTDQAKARVEARLGAELTLDFVA